MIVKDLSNISSMGYGGSEKLEAMSRKKPPEQNKNGSEQP